MPTALITGGTSGIGAAFARALAARGDDLVLVARNPERLAQTAIELKERHGTDVEVLVADLSVRADVDRVARRLADPTTPIDTFVSNAGFGLRTALTADDLSPYDEGLEVMVRAVLVLGGAAGRAMKARGTGTIITVSSTAGYLTMGGYSAIKSWATTYSESLAGELRRHGVTVTALLPGWVRTEFHSRADISVSRIPDWLWLDPDELVRECLADAARGRVISIPSRRYRALAVVLRLAPRGVVRTVSARMSSRRH